LPFHTVAVSPIPAQFGQGFPGLIYLSDTAYARAEDRPLNLRGAVPDRFFSDLLLPHEVAHQWWGNMVTTADYRSTWLNEAMANFSALQLLDKTQGRSASAEVLDGYRAQLLQTRNGKAIESYGPLEFGLRLLDNGDRAVWHTVVYFKGTWVMQMLAKRLGDEGFLKMQLRILHDFADRPITNEEFRKVGSEFVPAGQPDKSLSAFFDTWIYGTGIPSLEMKSQDIAVSGVDDDFTADIPLTCETKSGSQNVRWVRVSSGSNALEFPAGTTCRLPAPEEFLYRVGP
jgi:aminopeptidase N